MLSKICRSDTGLSRHSDLRYIRDGIFIGAGGVGERELDHLLCAPLKSRVLLAIRRGQLQIRANMEAECLRVERRGDYQSDESDSDESGKV